VIAKETIGKVRDAANLLEVVGESVSLKRQGRNYTGLCPFHSERSPSFMVRDSGDTYYCFGCGESGNVISYVMSTRGLTFPEAVEELASRYGVPIVYEQGGQGVTASAVNTEAYYKINHAAAQFFGQAIPNGPSVLKQYLEKRNLNANSCKSFLVGFSKDEWSSLSDFLLSKKFDEDLIIKSGLGQRNHSGKLIDRFRGRLMFPIFIDPKRIAGFGGRIIPGLSDPEREKKSPKYLNSPETEVYKKSKILYGLPQASKRIRESGQVYLVEGYLDVIGLWRVGIENTVATCGTAVTEDHIKRLSQLAKRLIVVFDGDDAGRNAATKMFAVTINSGIDVSALFLDSDEDPDTFAEKHGEHTEKALNNLRKLPLFECFVDAMIQKYSGLEGISSARSIGAASKGKIAKELSLLLSKVSNSIERSSLIETAAAKLMIESKDFLKFIEGNASVAKNIVVTEDSNDLEDDDENSINERFVQLPKVDKELLRAVAVRRDLVEQALSNPILCTKAHQATLRFLVGLHEIVSKVGTDEQKKIELRDFLTSLGTDWVQFWKDSYKAAEYPNLDLGQVFKECLLTYEKNQLKERVSQVELELKGAEDETSKINLSQEMLLVRRRLGELKDRGI